MNGEFAIRLTVRSVETRRLFSVVRLRVSRLICLLLLTCQMSGVRAEAPDPSVPLEWILPPAMRCLWASDCAAFMPEDRTPMVPQPAFTATTVAGPGELCLYTAGTFNLQARRGDFVQKLLLRGPSCYYLSAHQVTLFSPGQGQYQHAAPGHDAPVGTQFELAVPPLVAGPRGTEYKYVLTPDGELGLWIQTGTVTVRWLGVKQEVSTQLGPGDAIFLNDTSIQAGTVSRASGREARKRFQQLTKRTRSVTKAGEGPPLDFAGFSPYLLTPGTEASMAQALDFAARHPGQEVGARVLYFAWLKATTVQGELAAESLRQAAQQAYPLSPWTALMQHPSSVQGAP